MKPSPEAQGREILDGIDPVDAACHSSAARIGPEWGALGMLAGRLSAAQKGIPRAGLKGFAVLAADDPENPVGADTVQAILTGPSPFHALLKQYDVKVAVIDAGVAAVADSPLASRLVKVKMDTGTGGGQPSWRHFQAGVRAAFLMKGKGTEVFGAAVATPTVAAADALLGFVAASAHLRTPVVVAVEGFEDRLRWLLQNAPRAAGYLIFPGGSLAGFSSIPALGLGLPPRESVVMALGLCDSAVRVAATL